MVWRSDAYSAWLKSVIQPLIGIERYLVHFQPLEAFFSLGASIDALLEYR